MIEPLENININKQDKENRSDCVLIKIGHYLDTVKEKEMNVEMSMKNFIGGYYEI